MSIKHMVDSCTDKEGIVDINILQMKYLRGTGKTLINYHVDLKPIFDYITKNKLSAKYIIVQEMDMKQRIIESLTPKL